MTLWLVRAQRATHQETNGREPGHHPSNDDARHGPTRSVERDRPGNPGYRHRADPGSRDPAARPLMRRRSLRGPSAGAPAGLKKPESATAAPVRSVSRRERPCAGTAGSRRTPDDSGGTRAGSRLGQSVSRAGQATVFVELGLKVARHHPQRLIDARFGVD